MAIPQAEEFMYNESGYLAWIGAHPDGYVLNTERMRNPYYMIAHRACCSLIAEYSDRIHRGGFTERDFIKVCAQDIEALRTWVKSHGRPDGSFSSVCSACRPGEADPEDEGHARGKR